MSALIVCCSVKLNVRQTIRNKAEAVTAATNGAFKSYPVTADVNSRRGPFKMPIKGKDFEIYQPLYDMDETKKNKPLYAPPDEFIKTFEERISWVDTMVTKTPESSKLTTKEHATNMYLELVKSTITAYAFNNAELGVNGELGPKRLTTKVFDGEARKGGRDWTYAGDSMAGWKRIDNILKLLTDVIKNKVEGDYIETGVWRGGASVFAKAVLTALEPGSTRMSYVCDSFSGLPPGDKNLHARDKGWDNTRYLEVPSDVVANNFIKYGMLDSNVVFAKGFFKDTMPPLHKKIKKLSIMRLDVRTEKRCVFYFLKLLHLYKKELIVSILLTN